MGKDNGRTDQVAKPNKKKLHGHENKGIGSVERHEYQSSNSKTGN